MADSHFRLRIPDGIKAEIEQSALANRRSINAEVIYRLGVEQPTMAIRTQTDPQFKLRLPQESESRSLDKVIVRLPDGLRDRLKAAAASNNRSMNAEIVTRLQSTFEPEPTTDDAESITAAIHALVDRLARLNKAG